MAFDGVFTHKIAEEISEAEQCHIDKIYQPSRDELVFLLRKKGFAKRLLVSAKPTAARVQFTEHHYENPAEPPMFCMLARKHFSAARLISVKQNGYERVIELCFEASNEMGDRVYPRVVCELIGNQSNIVLVNGGGKILDAVRRSDIESGKRLLLPGAVYEYPPSQKKLSPLVNTDELITAIEEKSGCELSKALLLSADGLSPLVCREVAYKAYGADPAVSEISDKTRLREALSSLADDIKCGTPSMLYDANGTPKEYSYTDISQYGNLYTKRTFDSYSGLLEAYYSEREQVSNLHRSSADVFKYVSNLIARTEKRLAVRMQELETCKDREHLRIYGELLKANLYAVKPGSKSVRVADFYDENMAEIEIPLDPTISPSANAARYFKEYKKSYTAEQTLTELTADDREELEYLKSVEESLMRCRTLSDISEIRDELANAGYIKRPVSRVKRKENSFSFNEYTSNEGYRIIAGKNNHQNDHITTRLADKNDLWFHVKGIPGSHVVVFCGNGEVSEETVLFAAKLAAKNSKASLSSNVPVDYTRIRYVKKPNGARPGMVTYTSNKTLFVTPEGDSE